MATGVIADGSATNQTDISQIAVGSSQDLPQLKDFDKPTPTLPALDRCPDARSGC